MSKWRCDDQASKLEAGEMLRRQMGLMVFINMYKIHYFMNSQYNIGFKNSRVFLKYNSKYLVWKDCGESIISKTRLFFSFVTWCDSPSSYETDSII